MDGLKINERCEMMISSKAEKNEKLALNTSLLAGVLFVLVEVIVSITSKSQAVLMDSVYDAAELVMVLLSIRMVPLLYKPASEKRPYGYSQVETLFIAIKGFMLASITLTLVINNIGIMLQGGRHVKFEEIAFFELFATVLSLVVIVMLRKFDKTANSPLLQAEIAGWLVDAVASFGMTFAFFLPVIINNSYLEALSPFLDQVIAILLSLFILPIPIKAMLTSLRDIFLWAPEEKTMNLIKEISEAILHEHSFEYITYDVVRTGRRLWISIYVIPIEEIISIKKYSLIQDELERALRDEFSDLYVELLPEID